MDAVITYVNGEDKFWREEYKKHVKTTIEEVRYRDLGTLRYLIDGIHEFMPFIEHTYLVVSSPSQIVDIDTSDVDVIYHKDIIPEKYLPCFNSCTIEMFLHKIPGLSEEFIYFNDDTFVLKPMKKTDFFIDGKPVLNPHLSKCSQFDKLCTFAQQCKNSTELIRSKFVKKYPNNVYIRQEHIMRPMLKSTCEIVWKKCEKEILNSLTRIRTKRNYNVYLFNDYDVMTGGYVQNEITHKYLKTNESVENITSNISSDKFSVVCINDNGAISKNNKAAINSAFENVIGKIEYKPVKQTSLVSNEDITEQKSNNIRVALCAIAKNENLYIREWVEWHKKLGISKIFLYDNNELDGERFEEVISDYINNGFVEVIDVRGVEKGCVYDKSGLNLQPKCYIDCYENKVKNFDWVCFFDIDEFLTFRGDWNLFNFLNQNKFSDTNTILITWEHYDDNNLLTYDNRPVVERFTHKSKKGFHGVKSIVRTNKQIKEKTQENLIHYFKLTTGDIKFSNGNKINYVNTHNWYTLSDMEHNLCPVVLNHYKTKTISEFLLRHVDRHWGTGKEHTKNKKAMYECFNIFFEYNEITNEKKNFYNNLLTYNGKQYNNEKYIISLTSWKNRIKTVCKTLKTLQTNCTVAHIVLVLSIEEFPRLYLDLPIELISKVANNEIEVLWVYKNYKSFKKILFTMNKYKSVPIISADDDLLYTENYAKKLYDCWVSNKEFSHVTSHHDKMLSGCGACSLYAPNCFKNIDDICKLLNDEIINTNEDDMFYQYLIDKYELKQYFINNYWPWKQHTKNDALSDIYKTIGDVLTRKNQYYLVYDKNDVTKYVGHKYPIVSFTSYKERLEYCGTVIESILRNSIHPLKIVLTLYKDDADLLYKHDKLQAYIKEGFVELIVTNDNLRSHKKYFYTFQKYSEYPIITIDDDVTYPVDFIKSLFDSYLKYPNCVHGRRVHKKTYDSNGKLMNYKKWIFENKDIIEPSFEIMCIGVGGVLYPEGNLLHISNDNLKSIKKYITVDDVYLHYLEIKNNIKIVYVPNNKNHPDLISGSQKTALWLSDNNFNTNNNTDKAINELLK